MREAGAVALLVGAILVAAALVSHQPADPSPFHLDSAHRSTENLVGWLGASLSAALLATLGLPSLLLPLVAGVVGWRVLLNRGPVQPRTLLSGWTLVVLALAGFCHLARPELVVRGGVVPSGGLLGQALAELLGSFAGAVGRAVVLAAVLLLGAMLVSGRSASEAAKRLQGRVTGWWRALGATRSSRRRRCQERRDLKKVMDRQLERLERDDEYHGPVTVKELEGRGRIRIVRKGAPAPAAEVGVGDGPEEAAPAAGGTSRSRRRAAPPEPPPPPSAVQEEFEFVEELESYDIPRVSFLDPADERPQRDSATLMERAELITAKCQEFRARGEVVNIRTGPVITTFEFRLEAGIKIATVQNLAEDLALALRTESVRIDRIPGRATVGIEVPNPDPEVIRLRQLIDAPDFTRAPSLLTLALGVDIHGGPVYHDLARMPHLLIGGFTGSGKSVGINAMIMSILYKARPDQVKFIFVDPKMVELGVYADIPHLLTPIITQPEKAANALGWAVAEMDDRYRVLAALGVRNLAQYNQLVSDPVQLRKVREYLRGEEEEAAEDLKPLPYIVIIIDELADLMLTSGRAVEESITRLSQKARAVGVHLICATQRPSVDILTGIIKANFPSRIAYKVRSKYDSRTILDVTGAEHLLGRGDMLFLPPGASGLVRLHGPLVTEKEIATVVRYIKRLGTPEYQREVLTHAPVVSTEKGGRKTVAEDEDELTDPMFEQAARVVVTTGKASASYIQRRLHLGYTRAARLVDMMEKEGLVGPPNGSKGREVLVPENYFDEVDETLALSGLDDEGPS